MIKTKKPSRLTLKNWLETFGEVGPAVIALMLSVSVFAPIVTLQGNANSLTAPLSGVIIDLLLFCSPVTLLSLFALSFLRKSSRQVAAALCLSVTLAFYLQGNFSPYNLGVFDGESIAWADYRSLGYLEAAVMVILILLAFRFGASHARPLRTFSICLLTIQAVGSALILLREPELLTSAPDASMNPSVLSFSKERNVVMILLDAFQGTHLDEIFAADPTAQERLAGFTYFRNHLGDFPQTEQTFPSILAGKTYDFSQPLESFTQQAMADQGLPQLMSDNGYSVSAVTQQRFCRFFQPAECINHSVAAGTSRFQSIKMIDLTLFRHLPLFLKQAAYGDGEWFLFNQLIQDQRIDAHIDGVYFRDVIAKEADSGSQTPTFKFFHFLIPHAPEQLDENCAFIESEAKRSSLRQSRCALGLAESILRKMTEIGVYDQSMIILMSDHGLQYSRLGGLRFGRALPILLVKKPGDAGPLKVSSAPTEIIDIAPTIAAPLATANLGAYQGLPVFTISEEATRERRVLSRQRRKPGGAKKWVQFVVNGDVSRPESWKKVTF